MNNRITFKGSDGNDWEDQAVGAVKFHGATQWDICLRVDNPLDYKVIRRIDKLKEEQYPCHKCGKLRTKDEGGTTFTLCDKCWDKAHDKRKEKTDAEWASYIIDEDSELRIVEMVNYKIAEALGK